MRQARAFRVSFDQCQMILKLNNADASVTGDARAVLRSCAPKLAAHDHCAFRIQLYVNLPKPANQFDVSAPRFFMTPQGCHYANEKRGQEDNYNQRESHVEFG
jgi:hypothetical protein